MVAADVGDARLEALGRAPGGELPLDLVLEACDQPPEASVLELAARASIDRLDLRRLRA